MHNATVPKEIKKLMIKAGLKTILGKTLRVHDIRYPNLNKIQTFFVST